MRKIALIALTSLPLFAGFFPSTVYTSVKSISAQEITMNNSFPLNGMSGIIIHKYTPEVEAITSRLIQTSKGHAVLSNIDVVHHEELPTIKTAVSRGDKIIGGYLYGTILVLAPDATTYNKITSSYNKHWIHPDLYAVYLSQEGEGKATRENLRDFATMYHIGLIYIVKRDSAVLLDPISGKHVGKKAVGKLPAKAHIPFFMRFDEIKTGWFSQTASGSYYDLVEPL